jgi:radical SAM protein with 4Fe4S-binding SPASM domain
MSIAEPVEMFKFLVDNKFSRGILKKLNEYCEEDEKSRLEIALELYSGVREDACGKCKLASKIVNGVIDLGARSFGADKEEIKRAMRDSYWRRGLSSVVKGIATFGVRRPFVPGAPFLVVWDVTYACNLRCKHCYANAGRPLPDELSTEEAKRVIDTFDKAGVVAIAWSGGEPIVRPDIYELSRYAYEKGIYVAMATNGTLINENTAQKLWDSGVRFLQISLDGANPRTHDEFRGVDGAWKRATNAIKIASKIGFFVNVAMTATKDNWREIPSVIDLSEKLGAKWFMMYNFIPTGRGIFIEDWDLSPDEREELLKMLYRELRSGRKINVLTTAPQFSRIALMMEGNSENFIFPTHFTNAELGRKLKSLAEFIGGCGAGRFYIGLWPNGDIRPCVFFPMKIGNIMEILDRFDDWWAHDKVLNDLRDKDALESYCGQCPFRYVCGGCRARAYGYFHDYMAPDPGCILNKAAYESLLASVKSS